MKPLVSVCVALALAVVPAAASAQVTQTYQYDANGRLTGVATTGAAGTNTAAYAYDDADNRTSRSQTGTTAYATLLPQAYDTLWPFPSSGPTQALTFDPFTLAYEGHDDVAIDGSAEPGPRGCIGAELSLSRWPQARADLVSGDSAAAVWSSHTAAGVDGGREQTPSTDGFIRWSARIGGERCSS